MSRNNLTFSEVAIGQTFYMKRYPDVCEADSVSMIKMSATQADSLEWGKSDIHSDQPCWVHD